MASASYGAPAYGAPRMAHPPYGAPRMALRRMAHRRMAPRVWRSRVWYIAGLWRGRRERAFKFGGGLSRRARAIDGASGFDGSAGISTWFCQVLSVTRNRLLAMSPGPPERYHQATTLALLECRRGRATRAIRQAACSIPVRYVQLLWYPRLPGSVELRRSVRLWESTELHRCAGLSRSGELPGAPSYGSQPGYTGAPAIRALAGRIPQWLAACSRLGAMPRLCPVHRWVRRRRTRYRRPAAPSPAAVLTAAVNSPRRRPVRWLKRWVVVAEV